MATAKKRGLGRTLDVLLSSTSLDAGSDSDGSPDIADTPRELPVGQLQPGAHQPRRHFDADALAELAASIAAQGMVQPIVVRPAGPQRYEIVAGERRWRAAQQAGLSQVPVVIRELDERGAMAVALVENIQRADLNPLEEAEALQRLIAQCGLTHEQVAQALGRSRAQISNLLRLIELEPALQQWVRENKLSLGHAKVLLGAPTERRQALAERVIAGHLSVRQTEALLRLPAPATQRDAIPAEPETKALQARAADRFGLPVRLQQDAQGRGRLTIRFKSVSELEQLLQRLG